MRTRARGEALGLELYMRAMARGEALGLGLQFGLSFT